MAHNAVKCAGAARVRCSVLAYTRGRGGACACCVHTSLNKNNLQRINETGAMRVHSGVVVVARRQRPILSRTECLGRGGCACPV